MPGVASAVASAGKYILSAFAASAAGSATIAQTLTVLAVNAAATIGLTALTTRRPDVPSFEDPGAQLRPQRGGVIPRTIVYGETLVAGHIVFAKASGEDRKNLDLIIAIGDGGPYESIEAVYFDDTQLTLDGSGNVTSPSKYNGFATILTELGAEDQAANATAVSNISEWTTNHRGRGVCYAYARMVYDPEVWTQGLPTLFFKVRGRKVYDPRLDSTNGGSGAHRKDDPTTWAFSQNKALWLLDWMRGVEMNDQRVAGLDVPDTLIDWGAFADAADVCDEDVDVDGGGTIKRYTGGGGTVTSADDPKAVADMFIRCMAGEWAPRSGYIGVYAGASRTAAVTLTDDDLAGPIRLKTAKSVRDTVNKLQATYRDPDEDYEMTDAPPYTNASWESDDGEVFEQEIALPFIDDHRQAQRICKLLAGRVREPRQLQARFKQKAMQCLEGDAFTWDSDRFPAGVQGKYIVTSRTIYSDGTVDIVARSETTGFYSWDETTEEAARDITGTIEKPDVVFGLDALSPADYRRTLLSQLPAPTLDLDFVSSSYDSNLGQALSFKDKVGWNLDVDDRPTELTDGRITAALDGSGDLLRPIPESIRDSSNLLGYTGGGLFSGDLTATEGADWSSNVNNRPTELTDGRITTALDASGVLQTNIANESQIPALAASKITSGTFSDALIAESSVTQHQASLSLGGGQITTGTVAAARIDNLDAGKITTGTFADARIAQTNITQHQGSIDALALTNAPAEAGATAGANFATNIVNLPQELTDGSALLTRLPTATLIFDFTTRSYDLEADRDELFDGRITAALDSSGDIQNDARVRQISGSTKRALGRALAVIEAQDGDSITFAEAFNEPPTIRILGGTGSTFDERIGTGSNIKHLQDYAAQNVTTTGFTVKAKIRGEATGTTARNDAVTTAGGASDPDYVGDKSTADEAFDGNYVFSGTLTGTYTTTGIATATIELYTNDGIGPAKRASIFLTLPSASSGTSINEAWSLAVNVAGLGQHGGKEFGITVASGINITSAAISSGAVAYDSIASITEYSATPGSERVFCYVFESDQTLE